MKSLIHLSRMAFVIMLLLAGCDQEKEQLRAENQQLRVRANEIRAELEKRHPGFPLRPRAMAVSDLDDVPSAHFDKTDLRLSNQRLSSLIQEIEQVLSGNLNREMATKILNQHLAKPSVDRIAFSEKGLERAISEGLVKPRDAGPGFFYHALTKEGMNLFGSLPIAGEKIAKSGWGDGPGFELYSPLSESIASVDGIADIGPSLKEVQFTTAYIFPPDTPQNITQYLYSGRKATAKLRLYDDGWRVEPER